MDTRTSYSRRMARAKWTPPTPDVAQRVDAVVALYLQQRDIEKRYKAGLAALADPEGDAVPIAHLAERMGVERKTIYRHLGRTMT